MLDQFTNYTLKVHKYEGRKAKNFVLHNIQAGGGVVTAYQFAQMLRPSVSGKEAVHCSFSAPST